jgi:hypothetical protein
MSSPPIAAVIAGAIALGVALFVCLFLWCRWTSYAVARTRTDLEEQITAGLSQATEISETRKPHQPDSLLVNEKGETVLRFDDKTAIATVQAQQLYALHVLGNNAASSTDNEARSRSTERGEVSADGSEIDSEVHVAAMQGEIHRIRAELLTRDEPSVAKESPPAYK